jgi:PPM family protein phosphatase
MSLLLEAPPFTIEPQTCFQMGSFQVEILAHEGQFLDVHYFRVNFHPSSEESNPEVSPERLGLLRVGSSEGGLKRELEIRDMVGEFKMVAALHQIATEENVVLLSQPSSITPDTTIAETSDSSSDGDNLEEESLPALALDITPDTATAEGSNLDDDEDYLEEEFLEPTAHSLHATDSRLFLLSDYPQREKTLITWLEQKQSLEAVLLTASQVCQFFRYLHQRQWGFVQLFPQYVEVGLPSTFFDLTGAYPIGEKLPIGIEANYCAPELLYKHPVDEKMSTYIVGALLYQAIHQKMLQQESYLPSDIAAIPRISQIINICLAPIVDRFPLEQLLNLLIESRKLLNTPTVQWESASHSTLGLSTSRLQNEDSHSIRQQQSNMDQTFLLAAVADGMGGMAQGEVASRLAIETLMNAPVPEKFQDVEHQGAWLVSLVQKANEVVADSVEDGGTTLSAVLAVDRNLMIGHVGDSRIFLIRGGEIQQLSEDHSMVAMLVASGQITYEESLTHPDRNMLIRSLGSKRTLNEGYVQDLRSSGSIAHALEDGDTILICSDGVWDLVSTPQFLEIFSTHDSLQSAVKVAIDQVLEQGANDNATLLALRCSISAHF